MRSSPHSQRGVAFLAFVAILSALSILFVVAQSAWQSKQRLNQLPALRATRVSQAADALRGWYAANARQIDDPAYTLPSSAVLLEAAGVPKQWLLTAAISNQQTRGNIHYRALVVWSDGDDSQTPVFNPATATLTLCPDGGSPCLVRASARVEGYEIQAELYGATVSGLNRLAASAQAYFHAHWLADPDHNTSVNYFGGCASPRPEIPCLASWSALEPEVLTEQLGVPTSEAFDAWGNAIEVANDGDNDDAAPYRLAFRATAPWGAPVTVYAVQRL